MFTSLVQKACAKTHSSGNHPLRCNNHQFVLPHFCCLLSFQKEQQLQTATTHHGVPAQRGPVGESAVAEAAHVGLLPRVDPLVPLEGVELGELLVAVFAAVRTLACKGTSIHGVRVGGAGGGQSAQKKYVVCYLAPVWIFKCWWREFL